MSRTGIDQNELSKQADDQVRCWCSNGCQCYTGVVYAWKICFLYLEKNDFKSGVELINANQHQHEHQHITPDFKRPIVCKHLQQGSWYSLSTIFHLKCSCSNAIFFYQEEVLSAKFKLQIS